MEASRHHLIFTRYHEISRCARDDIGRLEMTWKARMTLEGLSCDWNAGDIHLRSFTQNPSIARYDRPDQDQ